MKLKTVPDHHAVNTDLCGPKQYSKIFTRNNVIISHVYCFETIKFTVFETVFNSYTIVLYNVLTACNILKPFLYPLMQQLPIHNTPPQCKLLTANYVKRLNNGIEDMTYSKHISNEVLISYKYKHFK